MQKEWEMLLVGMPIRETNETKRSQQVHINNFPFVFPCIHPALYADRDVRHILSSYVWTRSYFPHCKLFVHKNYDKQTIQKTVPV